MKVSFHPERSRGALALPLCALALAGCITTKAEGDKLRADLGQLSSDVKAEREAARADREKLKAEQALALQRIDAKIAEVSTAMEDLNRSARRTGADLGLELDKTKEALAQLRGQIEETQHKLAADEATFQQSGAAADAREKRLATVEAWVKLRQAEVEKEEHPQDKEAFYRLALQRLNDGDYAKARAMFGEFLKRWPDDILAPNANYWIGETFYGEKAWNDAILAFQEVVKKFPKADKVSDALVKIGMSFSAQDQCGNAEPFYEEVLHSYGSRPVARIAKEKLAECKKAKKPAGRSAR